MLPLPPLLSARLSSKLYIDPMKLLPLMRFLPAPKIPGARELISTSYDSELDHFNLTMQEEGGERVEARPLPVVLYDSLMFVYHRARPWHTKRRAWRGLSRREWWIPRWQRRFPRWVFCSLNCRNKQPFGVRWQVGEVLAVVEGFEMNPNYCIVIRFVCGNNLFLMNVT